MPVVQTYGQPASAIPRASEARLRPSNAGDAGLGESIQNFGRSLGQYADKEAKVRAEDLMLQADQRLKSIAADYKNQLGRNAIDARPAADKALAGAYDDIMGATKDPLIKAYLAPALDRYKSLYSDQVTEHGTQQERVYSKSVGIERLTNFMENATANRDKPEVAAQFIASAKKQVAENLGLDGMASPEAVSVESRKIESSIHADIAQAYLAEGNVDSAHAYFEAHRDAMTGSDATAIVGRLRGPLEKRETYGDASLIMGSGWTDQAGSPVNYADPLRGMGKGISDAYGVDRGGGKTHNGVDFVAPGGTPIHSIGAGTVKQVGHDDKSGNFIIVDHGGGKTSSYSHMKDGAEFKPGDTVTPDTVLGKVGSTGHSTGNHLHLVVREDGKTVDPTKVIGTAEQGPKRHDLNTLLAQADHVAAKEGWTFERRERAKDEIRHRVGTDEQLLGRQEGEADRQASEIILKQGDKFTDTSVIPGSIWSKMSVGARDRYTDQAKANRKAVEVKPNGIEIMTAHAIMYSNPDAFKNMDLAAFVGKVTPAELDSLVSEQARLRNPANTQNNSPRSAIASAIKWRTGLDPALDKALDPKKNPEAYANVASDMEGYLRAVTGGKRAPTDAETEAAFNRATMKVVVPGASFLWGDKEKARYEVKPGEIYRVDIPDATKARITQSYRKTFGKDPDENDITQIYVANKGKAGFW